ncbi:MAG TPA: DUF5320 domain-containing protein [Clostridiales bacterium]|nr:DUF5320 domain-containing protein [Clostridiales bacterium]
MPRGDRKGPDGAGPATGRGLGYCAGYGEPGFTAGGRRRGLGRGTGGRGYGRGYGRGFAPVYSDVSEKTLIENEIRVLKDQMAALEKRLSETKDQ